MESPLEILEVQQMLEMIGTTIKERGNHQWNYQGIPPKGHTEEVGGRGNIVKLLSTGERV